jgi:hypothetical protein
MMWLVKFSDNWADEMDVEGFSVMSTGQFTQWAKTVEEVAKKIDEGHTFEWYIGTNEWINWESGKDFKEAFSCEVITDEEANILKRLLLEGMASYGLFPSGETMTYWLEDLDV